MNLKRLLMIKKVIKTSLIFLSVLVFSQNKSEQKLISKINKELSDPDIVKIESAGEEWSHDNLIVYLKNKVPILIIREKNTITNAEHTDFTNSTVKENIVAKFYFQDWKQNKFVRVGKIESEYQQYGHKEEEKNRQYHSKKEMNKEFVFDYDVDRVNSLIQQY